MPSIPNKKFTLILLLIVIADLIASYFCYLQTPLLGDLADNVLPADRCKPILSDPIGIKALMTGESYVSSNRFFVHWFIYHYFNKVPLWLQNFTNPVDSVYMCCAFIKTFTHIGISSIFTYWIVGNNVLKSYRTLIIFGLISSLFLASPYGYFFPMRVVDQSIVYTFAYAFSMFFMLLYLHPFVCMYQGMRTTQLKWWEHFLLILLSFTVVFHGPINSPSIILVAGLSLLILWWRQFIALESGLFKRFWQAMQKIPTSVLFHFSWIILLGLYSFYLGQFNSENPTEIAPLAERYALLWQGFIKVLFIVKTTPLPILGLSIIFYFISIRTKPSETSKKLKTSIQYIGLFSLIYILLLPLGGHRVYRALILRFDTMLPVTFGIFLIFGATTHLLLKTLEGKKAQQFQYFLLVLILASSIIDSVSLYPVRNTCERDTLFQLSEATQEPVLIPDCSIMSWGPIPPRPTPSNHAKVLHRWNITKKPLIYYYQEK